MTYCNKRVPLVCSLTRIGREQQEKMREKTLLGLRNSDSPADIHSEFPLGLIGQLRSFFHKHPIITAPFENAIGCEAPKNLGREDHIGASSKGGAHAWHAIAVGPSTTRPGEDGVKGRVIEGLVVHTTTP